MNFSVCIDIDKIRMGFYVVIFLKCLKEFWSLTVRNLIFPEWFDTKMMNFDHYYKFQRPISLYRPYCCCRIFKRKRGYMTLTLHVLFLSNINYAK